MAPQFCTHFHTQKHTHVRVLTWRQHLFPPLVPGSAKESRRVCGPDICTVCPGFSSLSPKCKPEKHRLTSLSRTLSTPSTPHWQEKKQRPTITAAQQKKQLQLWLTAALTPVKHNNLSNFNTVFTLWRQEVLKPISHSPGQTQIFAHLSLHQSNMSHDNC